LERYEAFCREEEAKKLERGDEEAKTLERGDEDLAKALGEQEDESGYDSYYPESASSSSSSFERPEVGDDRILKNRRPLITEKIIRQ